MSSKVIRLDDIELGNIKTIAETYAHDWCQSVKLSSHRNVTPHTGVTWISYTKPINFISFVVRENPFSLYLDSKENLSQLKPVDFSFPEKCVNESVNVFFSTFINYLNCNFDFSKRMSGDITYVDKSTRETKQYKGFRQFFNFPEGSKSKTPTNIGHARIEKSKKINEQKYDILLVDNGQQIEPTCLSDLFGFLTKFESFKVTIKPCKIISSPLYFGDTYKLMWQALMIEKLSDTLDDIEYLRSLQAQSNDLDNILDDTPPQTAHSSDEEDRMSPSSPRKHDIEANTTNTSRSSSSSSSCSNSIHNNHDKPNNE